MKFFRGAFRYVTDADYLHQRLHERWGNYKTYILDPRELIWKIQAKKQASVLLEDPFLCTVQKDSREKFQGTLSDKYLNFKRYFAMNLRRIYRLGLHKSAPLRILDIGSGCGFFSWLCKKYGHDVHALDIAGVPLFDHLIQQFGISRTECFIQPGEDLPDLGKPYDLIVAFAICFHEIDGGAEHWSREDWHHFLNDIKTHVAAPGGRMYLFFNDWPAGDFESVVNRIFPCPFTVRQGHKVLDFSF